MLFRGDSSTGRNTAYRRLMMEKQEAVVGNPSTIDRCLATPGAEVVARAEELLDSNETSWASALEQAIRETREQRSQ